MLAAAGIVCGVVWPGLAMSGETDVFDAKTGYRIARYRAAVHEAPPGGRRVSIDDLDRLLASGAVLLDVMPAEGGGPDPDTGEWRLIRPRENIPGSVWLADVGRGSLSAEVETYFRDELARLTGGVLHRAVIVYCQSDCWMAWNAVKRASGYGYTELYWYPEGSDGWRDHDRELVSAKPVPLRRRAATRDAGTQDQSRDSR